MKSTALRRVLSGLALSAITRQAAAQTPIWDAPASCPEPQWQTAAEPAPEQAGPKPPLSPRVEVVELAGRWRARLTDPGDPTTAPREFWGANCSEVTRAAVVAWSLRVDDANAAAAGSEGPPAGSESPPAGNDAALQTLTPDVEQSAQQTSAQPPTAQQPAPGAEPAPAPNTGSTAAAGAQPVSGTLGSFGPVIETQGTRALLGGIGLEALGLESEWAWKVHIAGVLGRPRSSVGPLELAALSASAEACVRGGSSALCGGPRVEVLRAVASQIASPSPAYGVLPALAVSALLHTDPSRPVAWLFELGALVRVRQARFAVVREGDVYELPGWGAQLRIAAAFRL